MSNNKFMAVDNVIYNKREITHCLILQDSANGLWFGECYLREAPTATWVPHVTWSTVRSIKTSNPTWTTKEAASNGVLKMLE